jgi:hypothetical protein
MSTDRESLVRPVMFRAVVMGHKLAYTSLPG